jgi:hypothetical protein
MEIRVKIIETTPQCTLTVGDEAIVVGYLSDVQNRPCAVIVKDDKITSIPLQNIVIVNIKEKKKLFG